MKLPRVLFDRVLEWQVSNTSRYRCVARDCLHGFDGIDYVYEKWTGLDGLDHDVWQPIDQTEISLVMATMAQELLERSTIVCKETK